MNDAYPRFSDLLNATGRPMLYSCSWPDYLNNHVNFSYVAEKCNLWRMYRDIYSQWPIIMQIVEFYGSEAAMLQPIAGPGHWNDADQLTVGDHHPQGWCQNSSDPIGGCNGLTKDESESMMGMWAMLASPLLMSNDLRTVEPWAKAILQNRAVIAVSQVRARCANSGVGEGTLYSYNGCFFCFVFFTCSTILAILVTS